MVGFRRSKIGNAIANAFVNRYKKSSHKKDNKITKYYRTKKKAVVKAAFNNRKKRSASKSGGDQGMNSGGQTIVLRSTKHPQQANGKWVYSQFVPEVPNSNAGTQATQGFAMGTISQLTVSTGVAYSGLESQVAIRQMNPNLYNTGSAYITGAGLPTTDQFVISEMKMEFEITSWMDLAQSVDLYLFVAKDGTQDTFETVWNRGYQQQGSGKAAQTRLVTPTYQGVAGYGSYGEPYAKPSDVKEYWKDTWMQKAHKQFNMPGGSTEKYTFIIKTNKLIKSSELDIAASDGNVTYPGLTCWVELVCRGQLVCDTTTAINRPTFATTRLGVVCKQTYVCHTVNSPIANRTVGIHSYNLPINTALANQFLIDVNDDVDVAKPVV